jgi:hypothetical protein
MKMQSLKPLVAVFLLIGLATTVTAQQIQYFRHYDQRGINVFETPKQDDTVKYDGFKVRIGAGFTQGFQGLRHTKTAGGPALFPRLSPGFNLAAANLNIDVQLADGITLNLVTYLASRHHNEAWVKGGYIQFDKLPFKGKVWQDIMKVTTIKVGHMEINYGDQHFRRSDGGQTLYNPFIENYIVDAFATEIGGEVYVRQSGFTGMLGVSNGLINGTQQLPLRPGSTTQTYKRNPSFYGKLAYDTKVDENIRLRGALSVYHNNSSGRSTLYAGDRTGSNYFMVMESSTATATPNFTSGRINPGLTNQITAIQFNGLVKAYGFELFGTFENAKGRSINEVVANTAKRSFNQIAVDGIYRFGAKENVFLGVRYNQVKGELLTAGTDQTVTRTALGAGWFLTRNVLLKGEVVSQKYENYAASSLFSGGKFSGYVIQAVVGF